jgi:enoyl-CoA hydratase/carnithine racemase
MPAVQYERRDAIAFITLNRPERRNALNDAMMRELRSTLFDFDDDDEADVAVLHGSGRAFCSGADVRDVQLRPAEEIRRFGGVQPRDAQIRDLMFRFTHWKPVVAAVHGYALGGGLHIALLCDLLVAEESAQLQVAETARGADGSVFWSLLRERSNEGFATDAVLTSRRWSGAEGAAAGVVSRLAPDGQLLAVAEQLARDIGANPRLAVRAAVKTRRAALEAIEVAANAARQGSLHLSTDYSERAREFAAGPPRPAAD